MRVIGILFCFQRIVQRCIKEKSSRSSRTLITCVLSEITATPVNIRRIIEISKDIAWKRYRVSHARGFPEVGHSSTKSDRIHTPQPSLSSLLCECRRCYTEYSFHYTFERRWNNLVFFVHDKLWDVTVQRVIRKRDACRLYILTTMKMFPADHSLGQCWLESHCVRFKCMHKMVLIGSNVNVRRSIHRMVDNSSFGQLKQRFYLIISILKPMNTTATWNAQNITCRIKNHHEFGRLASSKITFSLNFRAGFGMKRSSSFMRCLE